jgi:hypothetical protein
LAVPDKLVLRLYVAGGDETVRRWREKCLRALAEMDGDGDCELHVVNIWHDPGAALANRVMATPTLEREWPLPRMRLIGREWHDDALRQLMATRGMRPES